jgi:DeoR family transcriptional regulator of aga operon
MLRQHGRDCDDQRDERGECVAGSGRVELLMTGGHLRRQSQSFYGDQAEQSLQNYHFDLLFLGVDAIDLDRGVSTHNEDEARLNRKMCEVAERIIVVTDSSKFNRSSLHKIIDTQRIDMIIVDEGIPAESLEGCGKAGLRWCWKGRNIGWVGENWR